MTEAPTQAMANVGKPMPENMLMPLSVKEIDGGKMMGRLQKAFDQIAAAVDRFKQETGETRVKGKLALVIELSPTKDADGHTDIAYSISKKTPERRHRSFYKSIDGGTLLTPATKDAVAARANDGDTQLFTFLGEPKAVVDPKTLTLVAGGEIAGSINPAS